MRKEKGFTLIELLIVIVILGILAVAILSAINPLEQIRKANDSGRKSDSAELLNAVERYYTTFQCYPWYTTTDPCDTPGATPPSAQTVGGQGWVGELVTRGEVKPEFENRANLDDLLATENTTTDLVYVCFMPESNTFKAQANKDAYGNDLTPGTHICVPE